MLPKNRLRKLREKRLILFPAGDTFGLFDDVIPTFEKPLWSVLDSFTMAFTMATTAVVNCGQPLIKNSS